MPSRKDLEFFVLDHFTGIQDDFFAAGGASSPPESDTPWKRDRVTPSVITMSADGACQLNGTWGCVGGHHGGLVPAPRRVNRIVESLTNIAGTADTTKFPTGDANVHITSFKVLSPLWDRTGVGANETGRPRAYPDLLLYGYEWYN